MMSHLTIIYKYDSLTSVSHYSLGYVSNLMKNFFFSFLVVVFNLKDVYDLVIEYFCSFLGKI